MAAPEIVGMSEAADILGFSRSNFNQHRHRYDRPEDADNPFPQPIAKLACGPIWLKRDMEKWAKVYEKLRRVVAAPGEAKTKTAPAKKAPAKAPAAKVETAPAKKALPKKAAAPAKKVLAKKAAA